MTLSKTIKLSTTALKAVVITGVLSVSAGVAAAQDAEPKIYNPGAPGAETRTLTAEQSAKMAEYSFTKADAMFMQDMIVHHAQAIDMSNLIGDRSTHEGVALTGKRIITSQEAEIKMMQTWLTLREQSTKSMMAMHHKKMVDGKPNTKPVMMGMLSPQEMVELEAASGKEFDRLYLVGMIKHHQGALDMVSMLTKKDENGQDPVLSDFLNAVVADQSGEILRMQMMLQELNGE